jgi:hypothetical protein
MPYSHQVLCLACQESCLTPQLLQQHLSKNHSCHTSWLNSGNSGTLLTVLCSPNPTKKNARAQWSEFSAGKSDDDDDDDDNNFLYDQLPVYHHNPADDSDDSLSDISYHNKHDNLSSDLLFQEDEQTDSASDRQQGNSASERESGSDEETGSAYEMDIGFDEETDSASESVDGSGVGASGSIDTNPGPVIPLNAETAFSSTSQFPKDQANLVKLELVNLVLEIGAPLHLFHKIAQWAARANSCDHICKPNDCPHYKTYEVNFGQNPAPGF